MRIQYGASSTCTHNYYIDWKHTKLTEEKKNAIEETMDIAKENVKRSLSQCTTMLTKSLH